VPNSQVMLWNLERSATPSPQNSRSQCCGLEPSGVADLLRVSDPLRVWTGCFAAVLLLAICCSSQLCEPSFELAVRTIKCEVLSRDTATDTSSSNMWSMFFLSWARIIARLNATSVGFPLPSLCTPESKNMCVIFALAAFAT
jgi:hypothetical protein